MNLLRVKLLGGTLVYTAYQLSYKCPNDYIYKSIKIYFNWNRKTHVIVGISYANPTVGLDAFNRNYFTNKLSHINKFLVSLHSKSYITSLIYKQPE